jgi:tRNA (cytidine/uridine-2'-O-)-methyltransferase
MPSLVLYQPDIPQNLGACMRICACFDVPLHIIEPCGFPLDEKRIRRAAMDYSDHVSLTRHASWEHFDGARNGRTIVLSTKAEYSVYDFRFMASDCLIMGRESAGLPPHIHAAAEHQLIIPMAAGMRSLNVANSAAIVLSEARRQLLFDAHQGK